MFLSLISALTLTVAAQDQDPPPRASLLKRGLLGAGVELGRYNKSDLLQLPRVQNELNLTDAQKVRLKEAEIESKKIAKRQSIESNARVQAARETGDSEAFQIAMNQITDYTNAFTLPHEIPLLKVLDRGQRLRLDQIQLQAEGPVALTRPEILRKLNFSPAQIELITAIVDEGREAVNDAATVPAEVLPSKGRLTAEQKAELLKSKSFATQIDRGRSAVRKARDTTMLRIAKVMTKGQRSNFQKMRGEPFDFAAQGTVSKPLKVN